MGYVLAITSKLISSTENLANLFFCPEYFMCLKWLLEEDWEPSEPAIRLWSWV